ncbi:hypothetical protein B0H14DRAFT_2636738 [Mycena olivaceomarginata]|nr:hypothetical protein B0H14DRAFT_2636738 [Mycena olivaceomarginata]
MFALQSVSAGCSGNSSGNKDSCPLLVHVLIGLLQAPSAGLGSGTSWDVRDRSSKTGQEAYIEKACGYKAKYRETHRKALAMKTKAHQQKIYKEQYEMKALVAKHMATVCKKLTCDVKAGRREHVDSGDEDLEFDKDPDLYSREKYM